MANHVAQAWVGAGGWAYFSGGSRNALRDYSRAFSFVEVNSTFYELPVVATARRWRARVPRGFRFALKAPRVLTHSLRMKPTAALDRAAEATARIASALGASDVVLETPPTLALGDAQIEGLRRTRDILVGRGGVEVVGLEARAYRGRDLPLNLVSAMDRSGIVDVVDLSQTAPRLPGPVTYARLFGPGEGNRWEFTNEELRQLEARANEAGSERTVFTFHGVRMYKDAARFAFYRRTGSFPPATRSVGLGSLAEVLRDGGATFPATGAKLLGDHGWRVYDAAPSETAHVESLLRRLPQDRSFGSAEDVLAAVAGTVGALIPRNESPSPRRGL